MKKSVFAAVFIVMVFCIRAEAIEPALGKEDGLLIAGLHKARTYDERAKALAELSKYYLSIDRIDRAADAYMSVINDVLIGAREKYHYYSLIAEMFLESKQYALAMEYYQEAISVMPKLEEARIKIARVYEHSDLNELAKLAYLDALKINRRSFDANFGLASLYMKMGLNNQAMEHFRRALSTRAAPEVYRQTAQCAEVSGNIGLACAMLRQIPQEERSYADLINLGRLYAVSGKLKDAEESLSLAINKDTEQLDGYIRLALLYMENKNLAPAEKLLQIASEKAPGEGVPHFFLGCIYAARQDRGRALLEMRRSAELAKTDILRDYSLKFEKYMSRPR